MMPLYNTRVLPLKHALMTKMAFQIRIEKSKMAEDEMNGEVIAGVISSVRETFESEGR